MNATGAGEDLEAFRERARRWLADHAAPLPDGADGAGRGPGLRGTGSDDVSVFHDLSFDDEQALIGRAAAWQRQKVDAGFSGLPLPGQDDAGPTLGPERAEAFAYEESRFDVPRRHELVAVTVHLVAPTLGLLGTPAQRDRLLHRFFRADALCCQLFSEPGAGSDLAALATRAVRDGDGWVVNGQKVWSSGAQFAGWGLLIARSDPDVAKHAGMTAFLLPLDTPGVTVRPLRQMSGGTSFNEVFLDDVHIPDDLRLGDVGQGWKVALTTLGFEREVSGGQSGVGGGWREL
ncbi:MAG: acyl-CoA dehydrogenase family protein, partial [Frankia sp.]